MAPARTSSEVGRASEDETKMLVVHEVVAFLLAALLDCLSSVGEAGKDGFDVITLLHRDNTHVILLVDPDEEVLRLVVEIPQASGQWRPQPEESKSVESGSWNKLPLERSSSSRRDKPLTMIRSHSRRCSKLQAM